MMVDMRLAALIRACMRCDMPVATAFAVHKANQAERAAAAARESQERAERLGERRAAQAACSHRDWIACGWNEVGTATCKGCGAILGLDDRLNLMNAHFNEVIATLNKAKA